MQCIFPSRKKDRAVEQIKRRSSRHQHKQTGVVTRAKWGYVGLIIPRRDAKVLLGPWKPIWKNTTTTRAKWWVITGVFDQEKPVPTKTKHRKLTTHSCSWISPTVTGSSREIRDDWNKHPAVVIFFQFQVLVRLYTCRIWIRIKDSCDAPCLNPQHGNPNPPIEIIWNSVAISGQPFAHSPGRCRSCPESSPGHSPGPPRGQKTGSCPWASGHLWQNSPAVLQLIVRQGGT